MNREIDDIYENLKVVMDDSEKWSSTDWIMRIQWVDQIIKHHSKIIDNNEKDEDIDLFWIKIWGLIDEFSEGLEKYYKPLEDALNPDSQFYTRLESREQKEKFYKLTVEKLGQRGIDSVEKCKNCISLIEVIKSKFTDDELLLIYDYRVHIAHPIATYYRLSLKKNGSVLNRFKKMDRKEIQKRISNEFKKYHVAYSSEISQTRAVKEFCGRISKQELESIRDELVSILSILNPLMLL